MDGKKMSKESERQSFLVIVLAALVVVALVGLVW